MPVVCLLHIIDCICSIGKVVFIGIDVISVGLSQRSALFLAYVRVLVFGSLSASHSENSLVPQGWYATELFC